jgi:very-short-patch-repair endonuclease
VNQNNWENYQVEKDIERQKIIEYYGYQFLRYNKFILGNNPIEKINKHLYDLYNSI